MSPRIKKKKLASKTAKTQNVQIPAISCPYRSIHFTIRSICQITRCFTNKWRESFWWPNAIKSRRQAVKTCTASSLSTSLHSPRAAVFSLSLGLQPRNLWGQSSAKEASAEERVLAPNGGYYWFSHDNTKIQTRKLLILLRFYFHDV